MKQLTKPRLEDDFYTAINWEWLQHAQLPTGATSYDTFEALKHNKDHQQQVFFDDLQQHPEKVPLELTEFSKYYTLASDWTARNQAGFQPLLPGIQKISQLPNIEAYFAHYTELLFGNYDFPLEFAIKPDFGDANRHTLLLAPSAPLVQNRYFYDEAPEMAEAILASIQQTILTVAPELGYTQKESEDLIERAFRYDRIVARYNLSFTEASSILNLYNPYPLEQVVPFLEGFPLEQLTTLTATLPEKVTVIHPKHVEEGLSHLLAPTNFEDLKAWTIVYYIIRLLPFLDEPAQHLSDQLEAVFTGEVSPLSPEKRAFEQAKEPFKEILGTYFARKNLAPADKIAVEKLIQRTLDQYQAQIVDLEWLSPTARKMIQKKLTHMLIEVGYPERLSPLSEELAVVPDEGFFTASQRLAAQDYRYSFSLLNQPVDRQLWENPADEINAYYAPQKNAICFPSGILQAPFYSVDQSMMENYSSLGTVIAHEITHAFDPNGNCFDEVGSFKEWWSSEDFEQFEVRAQAFITSFSQVETPAGFVNGELTVGENIADAGGLRTALLLAQEEPDFDAVAFFRHFARVERSITTPEQARHSLQSDTHAPSQVRVNHQLRNCPLFQRTFNIQPGDALYLAPENQLKIW